MNASPSFSALVLGAMILFAPASGSCAQPEPPPSRLDSPPWQDQVIYFLMTDRFKDGDPKNDDQGHGEFDPRDANAYSGGDLEGIRRELDYIQGLGATAVWLTPPVANVWVDPALKMSGYHGYWAENFKELDKHLGALADYQALSSALHRRGMLLIQDIVANHAGDFFNYEGSYDPENVERNFRLKKGLIPPRPSQFPFSMNDAADPEQRRMAVYHWTPDISDYKDEGQRLTYQMSGLDDLNTANPLVREALRDSYDFWIAKAGVDGFRIDTARYVEHDFWQDFIHSVSTTAPGVEVFAKGLGKNEFLTFGEVWTNAAPFSEEDDKLSASYLGTPDKPEMKAVLNFPLALDLRAVFAKGAPPARLTFRLESLARNYKDGQASVNFIDSHDMPRFLSEGPRAGLAQALAALFTIPGIPVLYAGTEQGFTQTRAAMFAAGWGSGGKDHFDTGNPLYKLIRELAQLRKKHEIFRRGKLLPLYSSQAGAGLLAYRLDYGEERALALFNTADEEVLVAGLQTGIGEGALLDALFSRGAPGAGGRALQAGKGGRVSLRLSAREVLVLRSTGKVSPVAEPPEKIVITSISQGSPSGLVEVFGSSGGLEKFSLVLDGRLSRLIPTRLGPGASWTAFFDAASLPDGEHSMAAFAQTRSGLVASKSRPLKINVPFRLSAEAGDPIGDDKGPAGAYVYPLAPGFQGRADIEKLSLYRRGPGVKLVIKMAHGLSDAWNPPFGFDHVCFDVYMAFPGRKGMKLLPRLNANAPEGFEWRYAAFLGGWKAALYDAQGASKASFGTEISPAPKVTANRQEGAVEVVFDMGPFKGIPSFDGARFYVTAWDYDAGEGSLRPLAPAPGDYVFGGGESEGPRIMDDARLEEAPQGAPAPAGGIGR